MCSFLLFTERLVIIENQFFVEFGQRQRNLQVIFLKCVCHLINKLNNLFNPTDQRYAFESRKRKHNKNYQGKCSATQ